MSKRGNRFIVIGDPLFEWVTWAEGHNARTRQVGRRIEELGLNDPELEPYHPATLIEMQPGESPEKPARILLRTDPYGALPVYARDDRGGLYLSNSSDLIALQRRCRPDWVSEAEFLSTARVTYPHTLYEEIMELPPSSLIEVDPEGSPGGRLRVTKIEPRQQLSLSNFSSGKASSLTREVITFFGRVARNSPPNTVLTSTLSAGADSRYLTTLAITHWPGAVEAMTGSPRPNLHSETAEAVATALQIPCTYVSWRDSIFRQRYVRGLGLAVGSHRDWFGNHFDAISDDLGRKVSFGGIFADAILDANGGPVVSRRRLIDLGILSSTSHWSETTSTFLDLSKRAADAIRHRAESLVSEIQPESSRADDLRFAWPRNRALSSATYLGLMREWSHYEPFLCTPLVELGSALNPKRIPGLKASLYEGVLSKSASVTVPINPATADPHDQPWLGKSLLWREWTSRMFFRVARRFSFPFKKRTPPVKTNELVANIFWARMMGLPFGPARKLSPASSFPYGEPDESRVDPR